MPEEFRQEAMRQAQARVELGFSEFVQGVLDDLEQMLPLTEQSRQAANRAIARRAAQFMGAIGVLRRPRGEDVAARAPWAFDLIESSYRFGLFHQAVQPGVGFRVAWQHVQALPLTEVDRQMILWLREAAGLYLRPLVTGVGEAAVRRLLTEHRNIVLRRTLVGARARIHPERLAGYMADLTGQKVDRGDGRLIWAGGKWDRDWRRVARTEMAFANNYGHLVADLKAHPINKGASTLRSPKALVFKIPQTVRRDDRGRIIAPCSHCYRLWYADDETPRLYPLAEVVNNGENATGGQGGGPRKAADYRPTVGPTHPNCLCGPLQFYQPASLNLFPGFAKQLPAFHGQGFEGVP